jgi:hypothetical protein
MIQGIVNRLSHNSFLLGEKCNFYGKPIQEVNYIIPGIDASICNICVVKCLETLVDKGFDPIGSYVRTRINLLKVNAEQ